MIKRMFVLKVKDLYSEWEECHVDGEGTNDFSTVTAQEWGEEIVDRYNKTLRPGELPRILVSATEESVDVNPDFEEDDEEEFEEGDLGDEFDDGLEVD